MSESIYQQVERSTDNPFIQTQGKGRPSVTSPNPKPVLFDSKFSLVISSSSLTLLQIRDKIQAKFRKNSTRKSKSNKQEPSQASTYPNPFGLFTTT